MKTDENRKMNRKGLFQGILLLIQVLLIIIMLILIWKIGSYFLDEFRSRSFSDDLGNSVIIMEESGKEQNDSKVLKQDVPQKQEEEKTEEEPEIPAAVDFDSLHDVSENAVAWLYLPGTKINYVIAQAADNDYYLHRLLDGREAKGGSLFADYRNSADFSDWNTVIYGHNMKSGTMFATLMEYRDPAYYEEHSVMYFYMPGQRYRLELIAGYTTDINDLVYTIPATKENRDEILEHACKMSSFTSGVTVGKEDRLVTLSTCSYVYDDARYVVIGRLVEE